MRRVRGLLCRGRPFATSRNVRIFSIDSMMAKRRDLLEPTDPDRLEPEQRLAEVAAILAAGVIRMRRWRQRATASPQLSNLPESGRNSP